MPSMPSHQDSHTSFGCGVCRVRLWKTTYFAVSPVSWTEVVKISIIVGHNCVIGYIQNKMREEYIKGVEKKTINRRKKGTNVKTKQTKTQYQT